MPKKRRERDNMEKGKRRDDTPNTSAFAIEVDANELMDAATKDIWLLDSGVSKHMTFRQDWLSELQPCENEHVSLGDGTTCSVKGNGSVYIERLVNGKWLQGKLENVLYVPDLNKNLFSVGAAV